MIDAYLAGKEGTDVIVRYTADGAEKTAVAIDDVCKDTLKVGEGTIEGTDRAGRKIIVASANGSKRTFLIAKDASVDSEHRVVRGTEYVAQHGV